MNVGITIDNATLLRAIQHVDNGWPETHSVNMESLLYHPDFQIIRENEYLRKVLKEYLEAELEYIDAVRALEGHSRFWLFLHFRQRKALETRAKVFKGFRNKAFKAYEMLRRLTDWDNLLLKRIPTD